jgi:hypothetical protein
MKRCLRRVILDAGADALPASSAGWNRAMVDRTVRISDEPTSTIVTVIKGEQSKGKRSEAE